MRTTLGQVALSRLPQAIGKCASDIPGIAAYVNQAQQQLINAGGETGFWGGWQKTAFHISHCHPYLTLPAQFARIINMDVCRFPIRIQNEFYEMLEAGIGLQDFHKCRDWCGALEGYERGVWPSYRDLDPVNQLLRVYLTDERDIGLRVLVGPAKDANGNPIYSQDGNNSVDGFYLALQQPFTTSEFSVSEFSGIQKDATFGDVLLYQVDATSGAEVLLSRYAAAEITPSYRRYYLNRLPCGCAPCNKPVSPCLNPIVHDDKVTLTAMCKLEYLPANRATDYLIIGNIPALIEECKAIRYSDMDSPEAAALELKSHRKAIKYLNDEMRHYLGELQPAVNFAPWGTAHLGRARIGNLI